MKPGELMIVVRHTGNGLVTVWPDDDLSETYLGNLNSGEIVMFLEHGSDSEWGTRILTRFGAGRVNIARLKPMQEDI